MTTDGIPGASLLAVLEANQVIHHAPDRSLRFGQQSGRRGISACGGGHQLCGTPLERSCLTEERGGALRDGACLKEIISLVHRV